MDNSVDHMVVVGEVVVGEVIAESMAIAEEIDTIV